MQYKWNTVCGIVDSLQCGKIKSFPVGRIYTMNVTYAGCCVLLIISFFFGIDGLE